jgi:hypothetical protein
MIVKDEEHIIEKCLLSVAPLVDYFVICDTGSTDNTIDTIKNTARNIGLEGEVIRHEWVNFAYNRTLSLQIGRSKADYLLVIDADETLQINNNVLEKLDKDAYNIETILGPIRFNRLQLLSTRLNWYYEGVVHEYPIAKGITSIGKIAGLYNISTVQGSRSRNPNKYLDDAKLLEKSVLDDKYNSRSVFYLAQSYRDAKCYRQARDNYIKRLAMKGFDEELIVCYNQIGFCNKMLGEPYLDYYLEGYNRFPHRLECLYEYIHLLKISGNSKQALEIGSKGATIPYPINDNLFILKDIYDFLFRVELANCCINEKMFKEAIILLKYTLEYGDVPIKHRQDIYVKIIELCDNLGYRGVPEVSPPEGGLTLASNAGSIVSKSLKTTPLRGGLNFGTIRYTNITTTRSIKINYNLDNLLNSNVTFDCNSDIDVNYYMEIMNNDLKYMHSYKNIINFSRDIIILGNPSYDFLEKLSKLMTDINRLFIFIYDNNGLGTDKSKLIDKHWNLVIGNVGAIKDIDSYVDIIVFSGTNDLMVGWLEVCDDRLTYLAKPLETGC